MALNEQNFKVENDWWKRQLQDYRHLDSLTEEDFKRLTLCALRYIVETLPFIFESNQPERSKREDDEPSKEEMKDFFRKQSLLRFAHRCGALNIVETQ